MTRKFVHQKEITIVSHFSNYPNSPGDNMKMLLFSVFYNFEVLQYGCFIVGLHGISKYLRMMSRFHRSWTCYDLPDIIQFHITKNSMSYSIMFRLGLSKRNNIGQRCHLRDVRVCKRILYIFVHILKMCKCHKMSNIKQ